MKEVCFYFQMHQPYRLRRYRVFDIGSGTTYFDDALNRKILGRVAEKCYLPATRLLLDLVRRGDPPFRFALSLTGVLLEQLEAESPETLASLRALVATGQVELLGETYHHSLAALADMDELREQVHRHGKTIERLFDVRPRVFRNTELIWFDALAPVVQELGYEATLVEGADCWLEWRSPNLVYESAAAPGLRLLPRSYALSDDVGFRFSERSWTHWPLTADRWASWIAGAGGENAHVFLDFETFGEHQWAETGIFEFMAHVPAALASAGVVPVLPTELARRAPVGALSFPEPTSWADVERDTTAWLGNRMQRSAHERLYRLREPLLERGDKDALERFRKLTTSDHFYYMCTKWFADGDVHAYFNPYETPYDAYIAFMNAAADLEQSISAG